MATTTIIMYPWVIKLKLASSFVFLRFGIVASLCSYFYWFIEGLIYCIRCRYLYIFINDYKPENMDWFYDSLLSMNIICHQGIQLANLLLSDFCLQINIQSWQSCIVAFLSVNIQFGLIRPTVCVNYYSYMVYVYRGSKKEGWVCTLCNT